MCSSKEGAIFNCLVIYLIRVTSKDSLSEAKVCPSGNEGNSQEAVLELR